MRFGIELSGRELSGRDRVLLDDMADDDALRQKAKVNSRENVLLDFGRLLQDEVMSTENTSRMFFDRFFADDDVHSALVEAAGGEFHRRPAAKTRRLTMAQSSGSLPREGDSLVAHGAGVRHGDALPGLRAKPLNPCPARR